MKMRSFAIVLAGLVLPQAVFAHVTFENSTPAPGSYKAVLKVPHGCDGQPTTAIRVEIPEGLYSVKPMPKAGWTLSTEKGDYAGTYKNHGEDVKSGVKTITWSGGNLPDDYYDEFVFSGSIDASLAGQAVPVRITQTCAKGETVWGDVAAPGQNPHSLKSPAPVLKIAAAGDAHGDHDHGDMGHMDMGNMNMGNMTMGNMEMGAHDDHAAMMGEAVKVGALSLSGAWTRGTPAGADVGGGFVTITNNGDTADTLKSASFAGANAVEIHEMAMKDGTMIMRQLKDGLEIPAHGTVALKPGSYHMMLMGLKAPLKPGDRIEVTLSFAKAGDVKLMLPVAPIGAKEMPMMH